jgi:hypothetical protein
MNGEPTQRAVRCVGVDFSSAPTRRKPVLLAVGERRALRVHLQSLHEFDTLERFGEWLALPADWVGAFDFPFGLPRELVETLGWPRDWPALMAHYRSLPRAQIRALFKAFCDARPAGSKFAHRVCDGPAGSSPSMKWVNPPVAFMLHAGVPLLIDAGVHLPGLHDGDRRRIALEGYPGMLARELIGSASYKSDARDGRTVQREARRSAIVDALCRGESRLGIELRLDAGLREALVADASGDRLDAVLCLMLAAWAAPQPAFGLPRRIDPLEGWIVSAMP